MAENYNIKLINKRIISMILPVAFEGVLQMSAGLVMMGFIGRIDVIAVSALGISQRMTQMVWAFFKGITTGASVFVAQYYGAKKQEKMKHVILQTLISAILLILLIQTGIYLFSSQLLSIFDPSPELLKSANTYIRLVSFGLPFLAVSLIIGGVLQGMGNAKTPMIITLIMNIINITLGYILIFGNLGFKPMGIKGAAIATVLSQVCACMIGLYIMFNKNGVLNSYLSKNFFSFDLPQIKSVYKVGLPTSMESMFWQLAAIILTKSILTYGETAFAAYQLGLQAESISYMPSTGFGIAATAFVGQALGAGNKKLAKTYLKQIMKGSMAITSISIIILVFFPKTMMALLTNNPEVINLGAIYLTLMGLVQIPQNASHVLVGAMRGAGYTNIPMLVAGTGLWGIRVPFTLVVVYILKFPIVAIWVVMCIDLIFRFLFNLVLYRRKNIYDKALV